MSRDRSLMIVGGGPAGLATARAYRRGGRARVTMLTPEPYAPHRRPPLTKEYLRGEASREDLPIESDGWYEENGVELRLLTSIGAIDRERQIVITDGGEELSYDVCVLATGSEPIRPPVPGGDYPEILTMRTVENSTRLQDRVGEGGRAVVVASGDKRLKYRSWRDGWDEQVFEDEGEAFTVWYGKEGVLVGVLSHGTDEDYEPGRGLIESGEPFSR